MGLEWFKKEYGVPAKRGGRVEYTGDRGKGRQLGTITGVSGPHLKIRLDGDMHSMPYHPTWELRYLDAAAQEKSPMTTETELLLARLERTRDEMLKEDVNGWPNVVADAIEALRRSPPSGAEQGEAVSDEAVEAAAMAVARFHDNRKPGSPVPFGTDDARIALSAALPYLRPGVKALRSAFAEAFITCVADRPNYRVEAKFRDLKSAQDGYSALLRVLGETK